MADTIKISALDELTSGSLKNATVFPVVDGGVTKKVRLDSLQAYMNDTLVTDSELTSQISSVNSTISALTTDNITENTNLYYTDARVKSKLNADGVISGSLNLNLTSEDISDFDTAVSESAAAAGFGSGGGGTSLTVSDIDTTVNDVDTIAFTGNGATIAVTDSGGGIANVNISVAASETDTTALGNHTASINLFTASFYGNDIISGAQQIEDLGFVVGGGGGAEIPDGTISGSQQILGLGFITGGTFLSSSGQVQLVLSNRLGWDTSYTPENANFLYYTNARVEAHLNTIGLLTASAGGGGSASGSITSSGQIAYGEIKNTPKFWKGEGINIVSGSSGDTNNYVLISATGGAGSTLSAEFYLFTSSYKLEKDSFITGSSQIEALGFSLNAGDVSALNNWTGSTFSIISQSFSNRVTDLEENPAGVPAGTISGSSQIDYTQIPNVPSFVAGDNVTILQDPLGVYQISASVDPGQATVPNGTISSSGQIVDFGLFFTGSYFDLPSKITGSGIVYSTLKNIPTGFISSSQQITNFGFISESAAAPLGTISGSAQLLELGFITGGDFFSSSAQISESGFINRTEPYWQTFSASAEFRITELEGGTYAVLNGGNQFTGSQLISGSVTANEFIVSTVGEPIIYSATNLNLSASAGTVIVNSSPLRLASYTTSETSSISSPTNGDMIYVSTTNKFMVYEAGQWEEMRGHEHLFINQSSSLALGIAAGTKLSQSIESFNTIIGHFAGFDIRTGYNNTFVGTLANATQYESTENTAIGALSMRSNISGSSNVAVGYRSLFNNYDGTNNTAIGNDSLYSNTTGLNNVAVGNSSLTANTTGLNNIAIGFESLKVNVSGSNNLSIGQSSLESSIGASSNNAIGYQSLYSTTIGHDNVAIGERAGYSNTTGIGNIFVGNDSGLYNVSGSYNVIIGYNNEVGTQNGVDNQIIIGAFSTGSGANTTTIGNNDTTTTNLKGVVNAGTTFRMPSYSDAQTSSLSPANGDMIYNTTVNKFVGYANGAWVELH